MPQTVIDATVEDDGDLHVVEQRTFDFSGDFSAVWWSFDSVPQGATVRVDGVRMANGTVGEASSWTELASVPFRISWRDEGGPDSTSYSFDEPQDTVYVFFDESDTTVTIELDYTVIDAVRAYADVGELYWQFVGSGWEEDSGNVSATIALPSSGQAVQAGVDVRAWGHGPLDSAVEIADDGSVVYQVPSVSAGSYAEARIVFPSGWLSGVQQGDVNDYRSTMRLDDVIDEEQEWADSANAQRAYSLVTLLVSIVICLAVLVYGIVSFRRYGKELAPTFTDEYWRDEPVAGEHPAVIGRLCRFDRESPDDFTATVLHLANLGALRIDAVDGTAKGYVLTRVPEVERSLNSEIDRKAMRLLFDVAAEGCDTLPMRDIRTFAQDHPQEFSDALADWQGVVSARSIAGEYFESYSQAKRSRMAAIAVLLVVGCVFLSIVLDNPLMVAPSVVVGVALFVVSRFMDRRTQKGADAYARCKALKKWLCEFSSLDERPPTDVKVWGEFMVYAFVFGVAEKAMRELQAVVPDAVDRYGQPGDGTYVPWWVWYSSAWHGGAGLADVGTTFSDAMTQSMQAVSSTLGEGFSSGGGMGGGFSVGGGGGFGGGGGAR